MKIIDPTRVSPFFYDCIDSGIHVNWKKGDLIDEDYTNADISIGLQYFPYSNEYLIWVLSSSHFGTSELKNYSIFFSDDEYSKSRQVLNLLSEFYERYYYGYYSNDFDVALSSLLEDFESKSLDKIDISSYLSHAETTEGFGFFKTRISCNFESSNYKDDRGSFDYALHKFLTGRTSFFSLERRI